MITDDQQFSIVQLFALPTIIGEHLAGNAEVSYGAAPALAEKSGHVDEV